MARLIWAAAARRGAAVATSTPLPPPPFLLDNAPGEAEANLPMPSPWGGSGGRGALEVFTEGEERGENMGGDGPMWRGV